jgi:hypothetical protein
MRPKDFEAIVENVLAERKNDERIIAVDETAEAPAGISACSVSVAGKPIQIKVQTMGRTHKQIVDDIKASLP